MDGYKRDALNEQRMNREMIQGKSVTSNIFSIAWSAEGFG